MYQINIIWVIGDNADTCVDNRWNIKHILCQRIAHVFLRYYIYFLFIMASKMVNMFGSELLNCMCYDDETLVHVPIISAEKVSVLQIHLLDG